jgi:DNA-binding beta-propeller fold protein YncE
VDDIDLSGWMRFKWSVLGGRPETGLNQPMGLAVSDDGDRVYVSDFAVNRIMVADFQNKTWEPFAEDEALGGAFDVALDQDENVYVSQSRAKRVTAFNRKGERLFNITGDLDRPTGLAIDRARRILYVADGSRLGSDKHRVLAYDLKGNRLREVGGGHGTGDGQFYFPLYLALDPEGNLYVSDTMNFRVQVFDPEGRFIRKYGEHGDGPGAFGRIKGIAFDGFGNLYVADAAHAVVQMFNRDFDLLMWFGGFAGKVEFMDLPTAIAIDPKRNRIYVAMEGFPRINVYDLVNTKAEDAIAPKEPSSR